MSISHDEWFKALNEARSFGPANDPDALTVQELAELWKLGNSQARRMANQLVTMGRASKTKKSVQSADGGWRPVPAYKLKS